MKKIGTLLLCFLMIITCSVLGGCAGFKQNEVKYYNEVLAYVGNTAIKRHELLTAYNNYGKSYYVSSMAQTEEEALDSTLTLLINNEALYQYALDNNDLYKPTAYQIDEAIKKMFAEIDNEMDKYTTEAKNILNIKTSETSNEDSSTPAETAYKTEDYFYKKRALLNDGKISYNIEATPTDEEVSANNYERTIAYTHLKNFNTEEAAIAVKDAYLNKLKEKLVAEDEINGLVIYNKVVSLLTEDLIESEKYLRDDNNKSFSKDTNSVLTRYFSKAYKGQVKSVYTTNIQTVYQNNEFLNPAELLSAFEFLYNSSADKNEKEATYKDAMKNAGTDADSILYHHQNMEDGTKFGYFIHTLVKFTDQEKSQLTKYKDTNKPEYDRIIGEITSNPRGEDGVVDTKTNVTLAEIISEYNAITLEADYNEKLEQFINFMFKYTEDAQGTLVSGMPYVVGTNGFSGMETAFTDECISLMEQGKGAMSNVTTTNIDGMCISSYGIHFVMYVGDVNDSAYYLPYTNDITIEKLYETEINPLTHETYFDMLFDKVYPASSGSVYSSNTDYSAHEEIILETSKTAHPVVKYPSRISATLNK